jgi:glyoxylase-like metal-dependent hydrolase (beta-lactamase superfamily II)
MIYFLLILFLIVTGTVNGQERDFSKVEMKVTHVAGSIYMLEGAGGNIAASVGEDGIVIVDDQYAPLAEKIRAALKGIADKPVRFVINTHYHFDHTGGNANFSSTSTIIAHENVRNRLSRGGITGNGGSVKFELKAEPKEALPIITFKEDVSIHLNGEEMRVIHFGAGHTDGDSIIYFGKSNVVHMGDTFVTYGFPFIDVMGGGSVEGMIQSVRSAIKELPDNVKIIPGHGPVSKKEDVVAFVKMLEDTTAVVKKALAEKKTLDQMKQAKILEPWQKYSGDFINTDAFIETLYNSLTGKRESAFIFHN